MDKKVKIGLIVASIYFILAILAFFVLPYVFPSPKGHGTVDTMPLPVSAFVIVMLLAGFVGMIFTPLVFSAILPSNLVKLLCNSDALFPSCNAWFGMLISILVNVVIYFLIAYAATAIFTRKSGEKTNKIYGYIFLIVVAVLFYSFLRMFF